MKTYRAAVVGCGNISRSHFAAIAACEYAHLTAVCDIQPQRAKACAEKYGVAAYTNLKDLLADGAADVVHICTPHYLHAPQAIAALQSGCHVFCEKPMAIRFADAQRMAQTAQQSGKKLGFCFQNRYNDASVQIKKLLESGQFGKLLGLRAIVPWDRDADYYLADPWRGKIDTEGGGVLINQAIHTLDLALWFASSPLEAVSASISTKRLADTVETEDTADALLEFENGARAVFFATLCNAGNDPIELSLRCEKGGIVLARNLRICPAGEAEQSYEINRPTGKKSYWGTGHYAIIHDFYESLVQNRPFAVEAAEALRVTEAVERIYRAAGRREPHPPVQL